MSQPDIGREVERRASLRQDKNSCLLFCHQHFLSAYAFCLPATKSTIE
jgi:hypothetical protein